MLVVYEATFGSNCPVNRGRDVYSVQITTDHMIYCEEISSVLRTYTDKYITQEDITKELAEKFKAKVHTMGVHSTVRVYCTVEYGK